MKIGGFSHVLGLTDILFSMKREIPSQKGEWKHILQSSD